MLIRHFQVLAGGSVSRVDQARVQEEQTKYSDTQYILENYVANNEYLKVYDFDDHFADVASCDPRNPHIQCV